MINGGMVQYGMMNPMGFQNPNHMGFNQFDGFGQHHQFVPPSHQQKNSIWELLKLDSILEMLLTKWSKSIQAAKSTPLYQRERLNSKVELEDGTGNDGSAYDDEEEEERILNTQY
jgi:hypothetical protein